MLASLAVTLVLVVLHLLAPRVHALPGVPRRALGSFGGGLAVAYVFLHLLPELAESGREVGTDLGVFLVALTGFTLLYGLERLAVHHGSGRASEPVAERDAPVGVYHAHLGSFALYNGLITYTMPLRFETGVLFALLFTVAMGLHFVLTDRSLAEHYPRRFARSGRFVLAGALVVGWLLSAVLAPTGTLVVVLLTALLAGAVLLNVFKEELPAVEGRSSFPWFVGGVVLYSGLLTAVTSAAG